MLSVAKNCLKSESAPLTFRNSQLATNKCISLIYPAVEVTVEISLVPKEVIIRGTIHQRQLEVLRRKKDLRARLHETRSELKPV